MKSKCTSMKISQYIQVHTRSVFSKHKFIQVDENFNICVMSDFDCVL